MHRSLRLFQTRASRHQSGAGQQHGPRFVLVCLAALVVGIVTAFLVSGGVPPQDNAERSPVVRAIPDTSTGWQVGPVDSADPLFAPVGPATVPAGDVLAERVADARRTSVPLDPDDASYRRGDGVFSHVGEPLDPDDDSAMPSSGDVSHIGDYLDPSDG